MAVLAYTESKNQVFLPEKSHLGNAPGSIFNENPGLVLTILVFFLEVGPPLFGAPGGMRAAAGGIFGGLDIIKSDLHLSRQRLQKIADLRSAVCFC